MPKRACSLAYGLQWQCRCVAEGPVPQTCASEQIEPWGKQFFVFNAFATCDVTEWSGPRGAFPRLPPVLKTPADAATAAASSASLLTAMRETCTMRPCRTVLCVSDHAQRPLMFLSKEDFLAVARSIPQLKEQLEEFKRKLPLDHLDTQYNLRRKLLPYKSYGMQRLKTGEHSGYGTKRGTIREPKT